jgi:outer membrane immunogenic protein
MRKILCGGVALMALAAAVPSFAADLPPNSAPPDSFYTPAPVFNWSGLYVGFNGGYGFGGFSGGGATPFKGADAGVLGGTAGYNYQMSQFVVGLEGDFDWTSFKSTQTYLPGPVVETGRLDHLFTIRGRVGYAMDNVLLFVTGGYAGGVISADLTDSTVPVPVGGPTYHTDAYSDGYAIGGGLEYAFSGAISLKAEYLYASLGSQPIFSGAHATNIALHESLVRGGLNFHF